MLSISVRSFFSLPNYNSISSRPTLLQTRSGSIFKAVLLIEVKSAFEAREKLREAMIPFDKSWNNFLVK